MPRIGEVVESIRSLEESRSRAAEHIQDKGIILEEGPERGFLKEVGGEPPLDFVAAGVDGGLLKKEFSGVDVVLTRAVASVFSFEDGKLSDSHALPERMNFPDVQYIRSPLDRRSFNVSSSLLRLQKELQVAIQAVEEGPDLLLMDGSVLPQYTERPEKGSESRKIYIGMIDLYTQLFRKALEKDVLLAGVVEDSRSTKFCEKIAEMEGVNEEFSRILRNTRDTNMLEYIMEKGERTVIMEYTSDNSGKQALKDIGELSERVYSFYIKTAEDSTPVRIDFLEDGGAVRTSEDLSNYLMPLCGYSNTYGIPSVVVDADQRAKLSEDDMEMFESRLLSALGPLPGIKSLRRNSRPF
mgnify:CR=1 FL=1